MNLRIKELAVEARLITVDGITRYALDHEFEKRFAELIVKECIQVLDTGGHQLIARFHTRQWLSEHFGIEDEE